MAWSVALAPRLVDAVAVGVWHVAEARRAETDRRDHEIGAAQADLVHDALSHRELSLVGAASLKRRRGAGKAKAADLRLTMARRVHAMASASGLLSRKGLA